MNSSIRLMVQGDRDARGIEDAVRALGLFCKECEIGLNVGESGEIVRILAETGAHVRVHQAKPEKPNVPKGYNCEIVDCDHLAYFSREHIVDHARLAWAIRLAYLMESNGFVFFPGREGTMAHLAPIMAFIAKGERDKGVARPRRVALVDWPVGYTDALAGLFNMQQVRDRQWFYNFAATHLPPRMGDIVNWLTDGLAP